MKRISVLAFPCLLVLSACANSGAPPDARPGQGAGRSGASSPSAGADGFTRAASLVDAGNYAQALPALRCLADQGPGYEIAQYLAGYSLLHLSDAPETGAVLAPELRREGFDRLTLAAEAGWPSAQAELVVWLADAQTELATERAYYWSEVYSANPRDAAYGINRLDTSATARAVAQLSDTQRRDLALEADAFAITDMPRQETDTACVPYLRQGRGPGMQGQGSERGSRGGRGGRGGGGRGGGGGPY